MFYSLEKKKYLKSIINFYDSVALFLLANKEFLMKDDKQRSKDFVSARKGGGVIDVIANVR